MCLLCEVIEVDLYLFLYSVMSNSSMKNITVECGSYEQLGYWPNNFDDFAVGTLLSSLTASPWSEIIGREHRGLAQGEHSDFNDSILCIALSTVYKRLV